VQIVNDISFWQDKANFNIMRQKSMGVILRAGQGSWRDSRFSTFRTGAMSVNLPFGSYFYYDNNFDPKRRAEKWAEILDGMPGTLGAWLDLEDSDIGQFKSWKHWYDCIERFKILMPNVQLGIYTRASYFDELVPESKKSYFTQYPLWIAHYKVNKPTLPKGWTDWVLWQFTESGDGHAHGVGSHEIDMNYYKGELVMPMSKASQMTANFQKQSVEYVEKQQ